MELAQPGRSALVYIYYSMIDVSDSDAACVTAACHSPDRSGFSRLMLRHRPGSTPTGLSTQAGGRRQRQRPLSLVFQLGMTAAGSAEYFCHGRSRI